VANDIEVQITADASDLTEGLNGAADQVNDEMEKMQGSVEEAGESLDKSLGEGAEAAKGKLEELNESSINLGETLKGLHEQVSTVMEFTGAALLYEAFEKIASAVEEATSRATEFNNQAEVLGVTTDQYQVLAEAAKEAGVGTGILMRSVVRLKNDITEAHEGVSKAIDKLITLGFTQEEATNKSLDQGAMLELLSDRLRDSATSAETLSAVEKEFGARAALVAEALKGYHGSLTDVNAEMEKLGAHSKEELEQLHEAHKFWSEVGTRISNATASVVLFGIRSSEALDRAGGVGHKKGGIADMTDEDEAQDQGAAKAAEAAERANAKVLESNIATARAAVEATKSGTAERVAAEAEYVEAVISLYGQKSDAATKALQSEARAETEYEDATAKAAERSAANELKYDEKILNEKIAQLRKSTAQMTKGWEEYFKDYAKRDDEMARGDEAAAEAQVKAQEKILDAQQSSKQISPAQWANSYISAIRQIEDAQIAMYTKLKEGEEGNVAVMQKLDNEMAKAHEKATEEIVQAELKASKQVQANWEQITKPIENAFTSTLDGILKRTENFHQAMKKTFDSLALDVINGAVNQILSSWLKSIASQIASSEEGAAILKALHLENLVAAKAASTTQSTIQITNDAAVAGAGAFASTAAIPYVGPALAPAAAAEAEASVLALLGQVAAYEQGGIVGGDELALLHQNEMVLPPPISQGFQEMIAGGGGTGGNNTYHIHAHDAASFEKFLNSPRNRATVMNSLKRSNARGNRAGHRA
jgi:hypothetical protein